MTSIEPTGPGEVYALGQNERLTLAIEILYHTGEGAALAATDSDMLKCLGEYDSLNELNYLAAKLSELDSGDVAKFEAAVELGNVGSSLKDLINLTDNLDSYDLYPDVNSEEDYGYYLIDECDALDIPDNIRPYFDYEAYGRDVMMEESGEITDKGYIRETGDSFIEYYDGREVPEEYRVSAYPDKDTYKRLGGQEKPEPVQER